MRKLRKVLRLTQIRDRDRISALAVKNLGHLNNKTSPCGKPE
ncbi:hypothetical protein [Microseira wollei]|nr:hypothetical protein [Microseira wollei]